MKSDRKDMMDFNDFFLGKWKLNLPARTIKGLLETCSKYFVLMSCTNVSKLQSYKKPIDFSREAFLFFSDFPCMHY